MHNHAKTRIADFAIAATEKTPRPLRDAALFIEDEKLYSE